MTVCFGSVRVVVVSDSSTAKGLLSIGDASFVSRLLHNLIYTAARYVNFTKEDVSMAISMYNLRVREARQLY